MTGFTSHAPASPTLLSELIGLIYEAASDLSLWPQLLESMSEYLSSGDGNAVAALSDPANIVAGWFQGEGAPSLAAVSEQEQTLLACLAPHFVRAHDIHLQLNEAYDERNLLEGVMDRLPLGIAIIDGHGNAISVNRTLLPLLRDGRLLRMEAGRLVSRPKEVLREVLSRVVAGTHGDEPVRLEDGSGEALSLWISRLAVPTSGGRKPDRFILLAASKTARALSIDGLRTLFDLTPAEARLTQQLVLGRTLDEAAAGLNISANTVKTQLKRVFAKVGVRRQAELLQAVYASPLWLNGEDDLGGRGLPSASGVAVSDVNQAGLRLGDGRWLAYSDNGDPDGLPLLLMHGLAGSCHLFPPDEEVLLRNRIRLIIPERPGSGDSDPMPGRRVVDWPADVAALAAHLGLGRFAVMGYSIGTVYALATAAAMPEQVCGVTLVSAVGPVENLEDVNQYMPTFRMALMVARYAPSLLPPLLRVVVKGIRKNVFRYIEQSLVTATESDRRVLESARLRTSYAHGLLAGVKRGEQDIALEVLLVARDWGFDLAALQQPVQMWHGDGDRVVNMVNAARLAGRLPTAELTEIPGGGHYVIYSHWEDILKGVQSGAHDA